MSELDRIFGRLRDIREELEQAAEVPERRRLLESERERLQAEAEQFVQRAGRTGPDTGVGRATEGVAPLAG
jgi:DNA-binding transcriptional regulator YbjK